jgi:hypothetical protein
MLKANMALSIPIIYIKYRKAKNFKSSLKVPKRQSAKTPKKNNLLDQMEAINPLNHYYNLFCLGRLSENISKIRITLLLFLKIKLHNGAE